MIAIYDGTKMLYCFRIKFHHKKTTKSLKSLTGKISFVAKNYLN